MKKGKAIRSIGEPFLCKHCNKPWQPLRDQGDHMDDYLMGFPRLGCTIKSCGKCKKAEEAAINVKGQ